MVILKLFDTFEMSCGLTKVPVRFTKTFPVIDLTNEDSSSDDEEL